MDMYKTLYENNKDFREYVDRFAKAKKKPVEEVLSWAIIYEVADYYIKNPSEGV